MTSSRVGEQSRTLDELLELEMKKCIEEVKAKFTNSFEEKLRDDEMKEYEVLLEFVRNFERGRWKR